MSFPGIRPPFHVVQGLTQEFCIYICNYVLSGEPNLFVQLTGDVATRNFTDRIFIDPLSLRAIRTETSNNAPNEGFFQFNFSPLLLFPVGFFFFSLCLVTA